MSAPTRRGRWIRNLPAAGIEIAGVALVAVGIHKIFEPAAFIFAGVSLAFIAQGDGAAPVTFLKNAAADIGLKGFSFGEPPTELWASSFRYWEVVPGKAAPVDARRLKSLSPTSS